MIMSPCKDCKGHVLTSGRCHKTCSRYKIYQSENEKAKKILKRRLIIVVQYLLNTNTQRRDMYETIRISDISNENL